MRMEIGLRVCWLSSGMGGSQTVRAVQILNLSSLSLRTSAHFSESGVTPNSAMRNLITFSIVTQPVGICSSEGDIPSIAPSKRG